jgi:uncharacterized protein YukE
MTLLPGDAAAVAATAEALEFREQRALGVGDGLVQARSDVAWSGAAHDGFAAHADRLHERTRALATTSGGVGDVLRGYAEALARYEAQAAQAGTAVSDALSAVQAAVRDGREPFTGLVGLARARLARQRVAESAEAAAAEAAARIDALVGTLADAEEEQAQADREVGDGVLDDASWDPDDVVQGSIGSCYLLSSVMGLMRTDDGDALLRENLRWDPVAGGYWVTLYPDGDAREYFVAAVYGHGVTDRTAGDRVGIASLYEAAVGQHLGYPDLNDGGYPEDAMRLVTGGDARSYTTSSTWWNPFDDEFDDHRGRIADALAGGAAVTADTGGRSTAQDLEVQVAGASGTTTRTVSVAGGHAYMVERVDDDGGVWVRNPWGAGNSYDGGDAFRLSPAQFAEVFGRVSVSDEP